MLGKILGFALLFTVIGAVVIFIEPIKNFSETVNMQDASIPELRSALEKNPKNVTVAVLLAEEYRKQQDLEYYRMAENIYTEILKQDVNNVEALMGYGRLLEDQPGRDNEALAQYRKALKVNQSNPLLLTSLGAFYKRQAENPTPMDSELRKWLYKWSVYYYRLSLRVKPEDFQSRFNLGVAYQQLDERKNAAREYCNAIAISPGSYEARYNLGLVLLDLNHINEAERQFQKAIALLSNGDLGTDAQQLSAQQLTRTIENVKSSVYYDETKSGLAPGEPLDFMSPDCMIKQVEAENGI